MAKGVVLALLAAFIIGWNTVGAGRSLKLEEGIANETSKKLEAKSAVMLDVETGDWVYAQNADKPLPPASMSKLMTETIVLDNIAAGKLSWSDEVEVSRYAAKVGGSNMGLSEGQRLSVETLFRGMAVHSANDASVALAEHIAGSERAFVKRMNAKAKEIGLSRQSRFANATGLSSADLDAFAEAASKGETVMTAKDMAKLARYLVRTYPDVLKYTQQRETRGYGARQALKTTNEMLPGQRFGTAGNDGLKTGYTAAAGYCFTGSFQVDGRRYVTVVMGTSSADARFDQTRALLELGLSEGRRVA
ncbi:D-alanyl-D-alanine carboxypeptidase family protein [Cohnella sp. REN36]|uniref:D-alanyl-D-alanine carboxypeptidase family protein n=1 Tax=Cohnella sp. REN36 TaxID=2887347 RepID=UPI001D141B2E|nr:D-alanyl-D-alanine carboxypeptidase family protein [Cohnella sp. REN36]MCC3373414.1 D-alanyl-D-alanine carboxypeptidase [Cohnella sp. REN36]